MNQERTGRSRPESKSHERDKIERSDLKSAWALASPRFDGFSQRKHETSDGLQNISKQNVYDNFDLDLSIDVGSDSELLLTPPKASQLMEDIFDNEDSRNSPLRDGSLASFETESFRTRTRSHEVSKDKRSDESVYPLETDRYLYQECVGTRNYRDLKEGETQDKDNITVECALKKLSNRVDQLEETKAKDAEMKELDEEIQERRYPREDVQAMQRFRKLLSLFGDSDEEIQDILAREQKEQMERMTDAHEKALFSLKEEHKQDIIELLCSRVDLVRQQGNTIVQLKFELDCIRREYIALKKTSVEALDKATQAVATNCSTLKSYVQEEIRDSETQAKQTIIKLEDELKCAHKQITTEKSLSSGYKVHPQPRSMSSSLESSAQNHHEEPGTSTAVIENETEGGTWSELKGHFLEAIGGNMNPINLPPSDASVVSKLTVYDTCTADRLFKDICYNKKIDPKSRKKSTKSDSVYLQYGDKDGGMDEGDEFLDALS